MRLVPGTIEKLIFVNQNYNILKSYVKEWVFDHPDEIDEEEQPKDTESEGSQSQYEATEGQDKDSLKTPKRKLRRYDSPKPGSSKQK